jgi:hypothetical protein
MVLRLGVEKAGGQTKNDFDVIMMAAEVPEAAHGVDDKIKSVDDTQEAVRDGPMNVVDVREGNETRVTDGTPVTPNQSSTPS